MNKLELIKRIAQKTGQTQEGVNEMLNALNEIIVTAVRDDGEDIQLQGVGTFKKKVNPAHKGRNPLNGQVIDVKESHTIKFQASSGLKKVIESKKKK